MKFQVFDNNKLAQYPYHKVHTSWDNCIFDIFEDAQEYANKWLGDYGPVVLVLNTAYDYSGYGDLIEIRLQDE